MSSRLKEIEDKISFNEVVLWIQRSTIEDGNADGLRNIVFLTAEIQRLERETQLLREERDELNRKSAEVCNRQVADDTT
jgi:hypothetical protein